MRVTSDPPLASRPIRPLKYRFVCQTPRPKVAAHSEVKKIAPSDTPLLEPSVVGSGEALDVVDSNLWMCRGERAEVANSEFGGR